MREPMDWKTELRTDVVAKDLSIFDDMYDEKSWKIRDVVELLTMHQLIREQNLKGNLVKDHQRKYLENFNLIKDGVDSGRLATIEAEEIEGNSTRPKFLPMFSLRFNMSRYAGYLGQKIEKLNPNRRLLAKYILQGELLSYAKEMGTDFPDRPSISKGGGLKTSPSDKKRGITGSNARWNPRDEIVAKAKEFMDFLVKECDCQCRHDVLAKITYTCGNNNGSFQELDKKGFNLMAQFKNAALEVVPEERQFGNDHDPKAPKNPNPNKSQPYNPDACKCPIPDHQTFKSPF